MAYCGFSALAHFDCTLQTPFRTCMQEWSGARMEVEPFMLTGGLGLEHERGEHTFYLLVKYIVRPSIAKEFIGKVLKVGLLFQSTVVLFIPGKGTTMMCCMLLIPQTALLYIVPLPAA